MTGSTNLIWGPLTYLPNLDGGGGDSTSTVEKTKIFVLKVTFYICKYYRNYTAEKDFLKYKLIAVVQCINKQNIAGKKNVKKC